MHPLRILRYIKHTFWPGFNNSFHPYLVRVPALAFATACLLLVQVVGYVDAQSGDTLGVSDSISGEKLIRGTNQQRTELGLEPLRESRRLTAAARSKARHMLQRDYWGHYGPGGKTPWSFVQEEGYDYRHVGENLAKGFHTSDGVMEGWLNSPEHRDNMLGAQYRDMGAAAVHGYLEGEQTTVAVAMYAASRDNTHASAGATFNRDTNHTAVVLPATQTYSASNPLNILQTMTLAAQLAAAVALMLGAVYIAQHVVVRRNYLLWDKHVHPRPLLQTAALVGIVAVLIHTSYGAVG